MEDKNAFITVRGDNFSINLYNKDADLSRFTKATMTLRRTSDSEIKLSDSKELADFQVEEMAKKELAKEFNVMPVVNEVLEQQDQIMMTLTEMFEMLGQGA